MQKQLPQQAQVVVIGGGIIGCSTAYHLAHLGWTDVVVLDRKTLASGTTWAAAGLLGQFKSNPQLTRLVKYANELYSRLEAETGLASGYVRVGSLSLCQTEDRYRELLRVADTARAYGIEIDEIPLSQAEALGPGMSTTGLKAAFHIPGDGVTNPIDTTLALAKGARNKGVRIFENTVVTGIDLVDGAVCGVQTDQGHLNCEYVVNCAGMWAPMIGGMVDVAIPLHPVEHSHAVTLPIEGLAKRFPIVRDFDGWTYFKAEAGGLLFGGSEPKAKPWGHKGIPEKWEFTRLQEDWDQFEVFMECALMRFPSLETAEIRSMDVVPESFTPDSNFIMGEAAGVRNFFIACGMNSTGIACAAGVGRELAQWMVQGYPESDFWPVSPKRFYGWQQNRTYLRDRAVEALGVNYHHHYPNRQKETARRAICSPLHDRLVGLGACFAQIAGWERADWFDPDGVASQHQYDWTTPNWFAYQAAEHKAARAGVVIYDGSSMAKFMVQGRDAEAVMQHLCANEMAVPMGKLVYTPVLNERGGFESDLTVTRLAEDHYFVVTATATGVRDMDWFRRNMPADALATITDVTHGFGMLAVMGPKSRQLLAGLTDADLGNAAFPYLTAQTIDMGYARPLALRISYVGELGWELYLPTNFMIPVFDALCAQGDKFVLKHIGLQAVNSLRVEAGYRHWEAEMTPDETPYEVGLEFGVKLDKGDFIGRRALLRQKERGIHRRLVSVTADNENIRLYGHEPVKRDGVIVGEITSGAYGHSLGRAVGMAFVARSDGPVDTSWIESGRYHATVEGADVALQVRLKAPYDPEGKRVRL